MDPLLGVVAFLLLIPLAITYGLRRTRAMWATSILLFALGLYLKQTAEPPPTQGLPLFIIPDDFMANAVLVMALVNIGFALLLRARAWVASLPARPAPPAPPAADLPRAVVVPSQREP